MSVKGMRVKTPLHRLLAVTRNINKLALVIAADQTTDQLENIAFRSKRKGKGKHGNYRMFCSGCEPQKRSVLLFMSLITNNSGKPKPQTPVLQCLRTLLLTQTCGHPLPGRPRRLQRLWSRR